MIFKSGIPFIRNSVGDFVVVIFLYGLIKSIFPKASPVLLVTGILVYAIAIEVLQLLKFPQLFGTDKTWVKILLGSNFSWGDILAYFLGVITAYWLDRDLLQKLN
ncbi:MAG: DUF2809 domain-containing protein [Chitinophagales bacterium]